MSSLRIRRALVFLAAVACLYGGALAIRSAAGWTGQTKPLAEAPPDAAALVAQLVDERDRAAQLTVELQQASARSDELQTALAGAIAKAGHDARSARKLARQLDAAQQKLAQLQAQLAARPAPALTVTLPAPTAAPASGGGEPGEGGSEDDDGPGDL
jgi:hypothetical protein